MFGQKVHPAEECPSPCNNHNTFMVQVFCRLCRSCLDPCDLHRATSSVIHVAAGTLVKVNLQATSTILDKASYATARELAEYMDQQSQQRMNQDN